MAFGDMDETSAEFDELLAGASAEARDFDRRLVGSADRHGWTTYTRAAHRNALCPQGQSS